MMFHLQSKRSARHDVLNGASRTVSAAFGHSE
jgi:hypothetical protein